MDKRTKIDKPIFLGTNIFVVESTYFKQKTEVAMGSCLSPIVAIVVIDAFLDAVIPKLDLRTIFVKKSILTISF